MKPTSLPLPDSYKSFGTSTKVRVQSAIKFAKYTCFLCSK